LKTQFLGIGVKHARKSFGKIKNTAARTDDYLFGEIRNIF